MALRWLGLLLLITLSVGCKPRVIGEESEELIPLVNHEAPKPKPVVTPPPELPPPPAGSWTSLPAPTPPRTGSWKPGPIALPPPATLAVSEYASFDELSKQFAETRVRQQVLSTGELELEVLYDAAVRTAFEGKGEVNDRLEFLQRWAKEKPEDATPLIIAAKLYILWGWEARGSGFAGTVSEDGFRLFGERLRSALTQARAAEKLQPADAELYRVLVDLAKGLAGKREHVDRWAETGRKIQPNYFPLYDSVSEYLLPRWHGEPGDIEKFAEQISTAIGGDDGQEAYARIALQTNMYDSTMLFTSDYDSRKIAAGAAVMERRYPQAETLVNFLALIAWKEQNLPLARKHLEQLPKAKVDFRQFGSENRYFRFVSYCVSEAPPDRPDHFYWPYLHGAYDMIYAHGGRLLTTPQSDSEQLQVWDRADLNGPIATLPQFPEKIFAVVADAAGKRIILSAGNPNESKDIVISVDDLAGPEARLRKPIIHTDEKQWRGTAISRDGDLAATCRNKTVHLWNPATGLKVLQLPGEFDHPVMSFSPDSKRLSIVSRNRFLVHDVADGKLVREYKGQIPPDHGYGVNVNRIFRYYDSQTIIGDGVVWPRAQPALIRWNPDDNRVVEIMRLEPRRTLSLDDLSPNYAVFSDVGQNAGTTIFLVRRSDGKLLRSINGHVGRIRQTLISPDESELATLEQDGPIRFWKLAGK